MIAAWMFVILFSMILEIAYGIEPGPEYPFSNIVKWTDKHQWQRYEELLQDTGITIRFTPIPNPTERDRMAEREECAFFYKDSVMVGYGITFINLYISARAVKGNDTRLIDLHGVEIIYDLYGRRVLLVSYSFRLNAFEMFIAEKIMRREPRAIRRPFYGTLDEGYELDSASQELTRSLIALAEKCGKAPSVKETMQ